LYCKKLLTNNFIIILLIAAASIIMSILYVSFRNISTDFNLSVTDRLTASFVFVILITSIFLGMISGIINGIYRAFSKTHISIMIDNISRLFEVLILLLGIILKFDLKWIVTLYLFPRIIFTFVKHIKIYKYFPYRIQWGLFDFLMIKKLFIPSISFMSFPLGNAVILQGFSIVINKYLGSYPLVLFNTTRTIINFIKSNMGLINNSIWPELTNAFGRNDFNTVKKLHRYSVAISIMLTLTIALVLTFWGESIYLFWTKGKVGYDKILMMLFLLSMITGSTWYTSSVVLAATNNHVGYSRLYLITSVIAILLCFIIIKLTNVVSYIPLSLLSMDIVLLLYVFRRSLFVSKDTFQDFVSGISICNIIIKKN